MFKKINLKAISHADLIKEFLTMGHVDLTYDIAKKVMPQQLQLHQLKKLNSSTRNEFNTKIRVKITNFCSSSF